MQSGFDRQIRDELRSEMENLEKNYAIIKDILSGVKYESSTVKGTLQSFKDNLSKVASLVSVLSLARGSSQPMRIPIDSLINQIDFALSVLELSPQTSPSGVIQVALALSETKIENIMSLVSILKKLI